MGVYRTAVGDLWLIPGQASISDAEAQSRLTRPIHPPVNVKLLIDSGSGRCCLTPRVIDALQCQTIGQVRVRTSAGRLLASEHKVRLRFPTSTLSTIEELRVVSLPVPASLAGVDGVIGRDVINRSELFWSGFRGRLTLRDRPSLCSWLCC